ncbi:MAG: hypothetical protein NC432_11760 [Roseburia sp.]|nr:hypothetical protein [Roseburia sp.]MCM1099446.1 hypothetical protein [Ruminococcus flavefaciens]
MRKPQEKGGRAANLLFVIILALYPLRHVSWGLDLWDVGYNYANFTYMGTEHMDPMWLFSTYLSTALGHLFTRLPGGGSLIGMNVYTSLLISLLALLGYGFCVRELKLPSWIAFLGEMAALSLCWCPGAVLYNYLTYLLFLGGAILLYKGLAEERKGCLAAAGVCLGVNVLARFSNLPEMGLILAVWAYDLIVWLEERKKDGEKPGFLRRTAGHTGWCMLGYGAALVVLYGYIHLRYGLDAYFRGISRLFAMTDNATDYKATSMVRAVLDSYLMNFYWVARIGVILLAGMLVFVVLGFLRRWLRGREKLLKWLSAGAHLFCVVLGAAMIGWLYLRKFCIMDYTDYYFMRRPGILFLMLTMVIGAVRIFSPGSQREEKLISGMVILVILLSSLGSNNGIYSSLNNLFLAAPYTLWESWRFLRKAKEFKLSHVIINPFPAKCILSSFLLLCSVQFGIFGAFFCFAEAHGVSEIGARVENNEILKNIKMSAEKARWMTELDRFAEENDLAGQEVILYGNIPALSYYLQMPSAFNPWSDLHSYSREAMAESMEALNGETPVIILENQCALLLEERGENPGFTAAEREEVDGKLLLIFDFIREKGYEQTFRNEKFAVYQRR